MTGETKWMSAEAEGTTASRGVRRLMGSAWRWLRRVGAVGALALFAPLAGAAPLPMNSGDINGDGVRDVLDVSCYTSATLNALAGESPPSCQAFPDEDVDLFCSGVINVQDVQRSILIVLYVLSDDPGLAASLKLTDMDLDLVHDDCDDDIDGDGFPNDCEIALGTDPRDPTSFPDDPNACDDLGDPPVECPDGCAIGGVCHAPNSNEPGNPCRRCLPATSSSSWSDVNGIPCDDGDACTLADQCQGGVCAGPVLVICDDLNPCTDDFCDPLLACVYVPTSGPCSDGNACTEGEACSAAGKCEGGTPVNCDDGNPCTTTNCSVSTGCFNPAVPAGTKPCEDGDVCTLDPACAFGACVGQGALNCDDGNPCTLDSCDAVIGCVNTALDGVACNDGDPCTTAAVCEVGVCVGQPIEGLWGCGSEEEVVCAPFGDAGTTVVCDLLLAAANATEPSPTAVQFTLDYDVNEVEIVNFFAEVCFTGVGCFLWNMSGPGALPMASGHSVSLAPSLLAAWAGQPCTTAATCNPGVGCVDGFCEGTRGFGGALVANVSNPAKILSDAYFTGPDDVFGDPKFLEVHFMLKQTRSVFEPAEIRAGNIGASDPDSNSLQGALYNGVFVTYRPQQ